VIRTTDEPTVQLGPVVLPGDRLRLEPLRHHHLEDLLAAGQRPEIWTWLPSELTHREAIESWLEEALAAEAGAMATPSR